MKIDEQNYFVEMTSEEAHALRKIVNDNLRDGSVDWENEFYKALKIKINPFRHTDLLFYQTVFIPYAAASAMEYMAEKI